LKKYPSLKDEFLTLVESLKLTRNKEIKFSKIVLRSGFPLIAKEKANQVEQE